MSTAPSPSPLPLSARSTAPYPQLAAASPNSPGRPMPWMRFQTFAWGSGAQSGGAGSMGFSSAAPAPVGATQPASASSTRCYSPPRSPIRSTRQVTVMETVQYNTSAVRAASVAPRSRSGSPVALAGACPGYVSPGRPHRAPSQASLAAAAAKVVPLWGANPVQGRRTLPAAPVQATIADEYLPPFLYDEDASDPIDAAVLQHLIALHKEASTRLNIRRLRIGEYEIEGRRVSLKFTSGRLMVTAPGNGGGRRRRRRRSEEDADTPLAQYLRDVANVGPQAAATRNPTSPKATSLASPVLSPAPPSVIAQGSPQSWALQRMMPTKTVAAALAGAIGQVPVQVTTSPSGLPPNEEVRCEGSIRTKSTQDWNASPKRTHVSVAAAAVAAASAAMSVSRFSTTAIGPQYVPVENEGAPGARRLSLARKQVQSSSMATMLPAGSHPLASAKCVGAN